MASFYLNVFAKSSRNTGSVFGWTSVSSSRAELNMLGTIFSKKGIVYKNTDTSVHVIFSKRGEDMKYKLCPNVFLAQ